MGDNSNLKAGDIIDGRYVIQCLLKTGGMGSVYKALDNRLNMTYAVKELTVPYGMSPEQTVEWFEREAKLLAKLSHPGLPGVIDYFSESGMYYIVMDFIDGEDFFSILQREGNPGLDEERVATCGMEVLKILDYLHTQHKPVIYRDMKPGNIMSTKDGKIKLIDFGIAREFQEKTQTSIGTDSYASPEQWQGKAGPRSDIYSLGATMHHLITGIEPVPFKFQELHNIIPGISPYLNRIVMKALHHDRDERFPSAKKMHQELNDFITLQKKQLSLSVPPSKEKQLSLSVPPAVISSPGSWRPQYADTGALLRDIYFVNEHNGYAAGYVPLFNGVVLSTADGGKNWITVRNAGLSGIYFHDINNGWAVGGGILGGIILRTSDGGKTWKKRVYGMIMPVINKIYFFNSFTGWILGDKGFILHTKDGGENWEKQKSNTSSELLSIYFINTRVGWITGKDGTLLYTADCGENWQKKTANIKGPLRDIHLIDERTGFIAGNDGLLLKMEDGFRWKKQDSPINVNLKRICFVDKKHGWIAGDKGTILHTKDGGKNWDKLIGITSANLYAIYFLNDNNGWIAGDKGTILRYSSMD